VKTLPFLAMAGFFLPALTGTSALAQTSPDLREPDVLYLDGNVPAPVMATFRASTTLYLRRNFQTALAVLSPGQAMQIVGIGPDGYLLKGTYRNNTVVGWIHPENLPTGFDTSIFTQARKNQERHDAVAAAIANKSVIPGMTQDEVTESLGRPDQVASRTDAAGSSVTWIFTTYKEEPQYSYALDHFGRAVLQTYYVKIPIGQMVVGFANGAVSTIENHQTDPNSPGVVTN
jgi:hypothetical protein